MTGSQKTRLDDVDRNIIIELRQYPPPTIRRLASSVGRSTTTVQQRIHWLMANDYVRREEDVRIAYVLTEKGFRVLE